MTVILAVAWCGVAIHIATLFAWVANGADTIRVVLLRSFARSARVVAQRAANIETAAGYRRLAARADEQAKAWRK